MRIVRGSNRRFGFFCMASFLALYLVKYLQMSTITTDDVRHLAQLSNLGLSDTEINALQGDIANILDYINQLSELDTTGVEPTYQVTGLENVWRNDEVDPGSVSREQLLELAPEQAQNSIKVPQVL